MASFIDSPRTAQTALNFFLRSLGTDQMRSWQLSGFFSRLGLKRFGVLLTLSVALIKVVLVYFVPDAVDPDAVDTVSLVVG